MSSTEVRWTATSAEDPFYPIVPEQRTILPGFWAGVDGNAENTAEEVAENYFDDADVWSEWFGEDDSPTVRVTITEPPASAGTYEVELVRAVKATATRLEPVQQEHGANG
jgi:hypothetical protein